MSRTKHFQGRMSQRSISSLTVDLVKDLGKWDGEKCLMTRKDCQCIAERLRSMVAALEKASRRGGIIVVNDNDRDITVYPINA